MPEYKLTKEDIEEHLREQIEFMELSAAGYDNGFFGEAKRLSQAIRVVVHDKKRSFSILKQLGTKASTRFCDTSLFVPSGPGILAGAYTGLISTSMTSNSFVPNLDTFPDQLKHVTFDEWWQGVVIKTISGDSFTRQNIVLMMSNKDGGAHVDPSVDEAYSNLSRKNSLLWFASSGNSSVPIENAEHATMRQIAHELLKTLVPGYTMVIDPSIRGGFVSNPILYFTPVETEANDEV